MVIFGAIARIQSDMSPILYYCVSALYGRMGIQAVQFYPGKHPCEKPAEMMRDIIAASSRLGDVVADFFMDSGSTIKEAIMLGRCSLGVSD